jgi:hypothetical protein
VATKVIEVDERTHALLVAMAARGGVSVDQCVARLAGARPGRSAVEREAVGRRTEEYLREQFGVVITAEERAAFRVRHDALMAEVDARFVRQRATA